MARENYWKCNRSVARALPSNMLRRLSQDSISPEICRLIVRALQHHPSQTFSQTCHLGELLCFESRLGVIYSSLESPPDFISMQIKEVVDKNDPRAYSLEMKAAINSEVQDLLQRGTFKVILRTELSDGANASTVRFILTIKSNPDEEIEYKSRYVIEGHRDTI